MWTVQQITFCVEAVISGKSLGYPRIEFCRKFRGQFHKVKKFVITKIIFVITNISNFVFSISTVC